MKLPKLHLRDLFWLTLVMALAVGWWADRQSLKSLHAFETAALRSQYVAKTNALRLRLQSLQRDYYQAEMTVTELKDEVRRAEMGAN